MAIHKNCAKYSGCLTPCATICDPGWDGPEKVVVPPTILRRPTDHQLNLLIIGEAPGRQEIEQRQGFVGQAGATLRQELLATKSGLDMGCYSKANIIKCIPTKRGKIRRPKRIEIENCSVYLANTIANIRPEIFLLVGKTATTEFLGNDSLSNHIKVSKKRDHRYKVCELKNDRLKSAIQTYKKESDTIRIYAIPHTSGRSWNYMQQQGREQLEALSKLFSQQTKRQN